MADVRHSGTPDRREGGNPLPEGWLFTSLQLVCDVKTGKVDANHADEYGVYPFYTCALEPLKANTYSFEGDLVILPGNGANVGCVTFYSGKVEAYQRTYVLHDFKAEPKYIYYNLVKDWRRVNLEKQYGSATNYIKMGNFVGFNLPIPPLAEQKVIAEKLDTLLAQVETTKARLDRIPKILKSFRQSVLAAAVSGKLTEEWRGNNGSLHVDLEQIAYQHKAYFTKAKRKYNEPPEFKANSSTPKIPDSWRWFRAEQLCDLITKGTTPKKEHMTSSGDIPYIKVYNLTFNGSLDFSIEPTFIPTFVHDNELKRSKVLPGDVLMNIVGPPLGKVSIVPDSHKEWNINQAISIFRPVGGVTNEYLSICLREEFLLELTKSKAKATAGQFNLTLEICRDYSIPVPPLEEQTEIVRRVEELFAFANSIEQKTNAALERVNNLTQSILAKAFRGELTADWRAANPDLISGENSAETLLERIKSEREAMKSVRKTGPRKKT